MTTKISISQVTIPVAANTGTVVTVQQDGTLAANASIQVQGGSSDTHPFLLSLL
jgi:hypothetical protein